MGWAPPVYSVAADEAWESTSPGRRNSVMPTGMDDRSGNVAEYLRLLRSLSGELEKAMNAIARNALADLEESVASQQMLSHRLTELVTEICLPLESSSSFVAPQSGSDDNVMRQIHAASLTLQKLNRRYAALLQHSSRSVALMAPLFSSFKGQFQEASGPRLKYQTWSCQM
jgi:hypothetical protein